MRIEYEKKSSITIVGIVAMMLLMMLAYPALGIVKD